MILALGLVPFVQNMLRFYPKAIPDPTQVALITNGSTYSTLGMLSGASCEWPKSQAWRNSRVLVLG